MVSGVVKCSFASLGDLWGFGIVSNACVNISGICFRLIIRSVLVLIDRLALLDNSVFFCVVILDIQRRNFVGSEA